MEYSECDKAILSILKSNRVIIKYSKQKGITAFQMYRETQHYGFNFQILEVARSLRKLLLEVESRIQL